MSICPFCGTRQDIDLLKIHFRDLSGQASMPCPDCRDPLHVIEFDTDPKMQVERCPKCLGMFFNPGELEKLVEEHTHDFVWLDKERLKSIANDYGHQHEVIYLQCPMCHERMSHLNFGGSSGVILDRCGTHGVWLQGTELRRLMEWWSAGGKHIHQQNEQEKIAKIEALRKDNWGASSATGRATRDIDWTQLDTPDRNWEPRDSGTGALWEVLGHVLVGIVSAITD